MLQYILDHYVEIMAILGAIVVPASLIANLTPTKVDDKVVDYLSKGINFLALNWKKKA